MTDLKWHVILPPGPGATSATAIGKLYDTEEQAWDFVAALPTEQGLRAKVLKWNPDRDTQET